MGGGGNGRSGGWDDPGRRLRSGGDRVGGESTRVGSRRTEGPFL